MRVLGPWLRFQRVLRRSDMGEQDWPWVLRRGRPNLGALVDVGPHIHWFTLSEAKALLEAAGFTVDLAGTAADIDADAHSASDVDGTTTDRSAGIYVICRKARTIE